MVLCDNYTKPLNCSAFWKLEFCVLNSAFSSWENLICPLKKIQQTPINCSSKNTQFSDKLNLVTNPTNKSLVTSWQMHWYPAAVVENLCTVYLRLQLCIWNSIQKKLYLCHLTELLGKKSFTKLLMYQFKLLLRYTRSSDYRESIRL